MLFRLALFAFAGSAISIPAGAEPVTGTETVKAVSSVTLQIEPALSDGRLVAKLAAKNSGAAPVQFGSASVQLFTEEGARVGWRPLHALIADVQAVYGIVGQPDPSAPLAGATASNQLQSQTFQPDVGNYHGSSAVAQTQAVALNSKGRSRRKVAAEDQRKADAEIVQLKDAILQDRTLAPGEVAAGILVSEKLRRGAAGKPMKLTVTIGTDLYSFNFKAPAQ